MQRSTFGGMAERTKRTTTCSAPIVLLGLFALSALAGSPSPMPEGKVRKEGAYLFAAIPWLTGADSLSVSMKAHAYDEIRAGRQKDRRQFEGRLFERWTMITALLDDHSRLIRWELSIPSKTEPGRDQYLSQRQLYDDIVTEMEAKYGPRRSNVDQFRFPYTKDDGHGVRALSEGLATIRSEWLGRGGDRLAVAMDERVSVTLAYESPAWAAVEKDRRRKQAKDL